MTAADFKTLSIGFVIELCIARLELAAGREDRSEETYLKMRDILPVVTERFEHGEIGEERYTEWMDKYIRLEGMYGFEYND